MRKEDAIQYSPLVWAYMGDAVYEAFVREYVINQGLCNNGLLHKKSVKFVSARAQCSILKELNSLDSPIVFMLWGGNAKKQSVYLNNPKHLVLMANHPSPLSANRGGFFGCKHFSKANEFLLLNGVEPINWIK